MKEVVGYVERYEVECWHTGKGERWKVKDLEEIRVVHNSANEEYANEICYRLNEFEPLRDARNKLRHENSELLKDLREEREHSEKTSLEIGQLKATLDLQVRRNNSQAERIIKLLQYLGKANEELENWRSHP